MEEIEQEMSLLQEEISEMSNEGDVIIAMDANAKIGLLNEEISRNGRLILEVFQEEDLNIVNGSEKCEGRITRQNTKNAQEISAIDFVVTCQEEMKMICLMMSANISLLRGCSGFLSEHTAFIPETTSPHAGDLVVGLAQIFIF